MTGKTYLKILCDFQPSPREAKKVLAWVWLLPAGLSKRMAAKLG
jgi:hypothetical protein